MSAETLREAARLMRERANEAAARPQTRKTGNAHGVWLNNAYYLTTMPAVALAVADWLDVTATGGYCVCDGAALAVARAYLGQPAPTGAAP